jgi:cytochrome c oxidase cbb3-type subunit 3
LLDHNYDGIRELDNNLPPWWLAMFYITIVMGVAYFGYYHLSGYGLSSEEYYLQEMATAEASVKEYVSNQAVAIDENTVVNLTDQESLDQGKFVYQLNCIVCHLESGGGLVGPNLTDEYWINGGSIKDVFSTIKYGVPEKGMIAWGSQLRPAEMQSVSSYILSLVGTNPANAKDPQGEKYVPEAQ